MSPLQTASLFLDRKDYARAKALGRKTGTSAGAIIRVALAEAKKKPKVTAAQRGCN
jgi:hypothetical protein